MPIVEVTLTKQIAAPVERVFAIASDFPNAASNIEGISRIEMLTKGPIGVGTRFKESRTMFGKEATEEMRVGEFEPPRRYTLVAESMGTKYNSELRFDPKDGGTQITMHFRGEPQTFLAKLLSVLLRPMLKSVVKACAKDLDDLKKTIEARA